MRCHRTILGIRWHDFVRNTEVRAATDLPCIQYIITTRRNSDHVVRLDVHTPPHPAFTGRGRTNWFFLNPDCHQRLGRPRYLFTRCPHTSSPRIITGRGRTNWFFLNPDCHQRLGRPRYLFVDKADRRRCTLRHLCRMDQGSPSWTHQVDATNLCCLRDLMMVMMLRRTEAATSR